MYHELSVGVSVFERERERATGINKLPLAHNHALKSQISQMELLHNLSSFIEYLFVLPTAGGYLHLPNLMNQ